MSEGKEIPADKFIRSMLGPQTPREVNLRKYVESLGTGVKPSSLDGNRRVDNTPEFFPHLSAGANDFLNKLAAVAVSLEGELALAVTPSSDEHLYTPVGIRKVVDLLERLVLTPKDIKDLVPDVGRCKLLDLKVDSRNYFAEKADQPVSEIRMFFSLGPTEGENKGLAVDEKGVELIFSPGVKSKFLSESGKPIQLVENLSREGAKRFLSLRGLSLEDVLVVDCEEIAPFFEVICGGSRFKAEFGWDVIAFELSVEMPVFNPGIEEAKDQPRSKTFVARRTVETSDFMRLKEKKDPSKIQVWKWLNKIAYELAKKAKR